MAVTMTSQFSTAKETPWTTGAGYEPVFLVEIASASQYLATRAVTLGGQSYTATLSRINNGGIGPLSRGLTTSGNITVPSMSINVLNPGLFSDVLNTQTLRYAICTVKLGFFGGTTADYITLFDGVIDRYPYTYDVMTLELFDRLRKSDEPLAVLIANAYFRGAVNGRGQPIPIVLGRVRDLGMYQVETAAVGTLAADVGTGDTTIYIKEIGALFPETGRFDIPGEANIEYTSRTLTSLNGVTVLAFSGLTRGSPAAHTEDETVTLDNISYTYLAGYECQALNTMREDGTVVTTGLTKTIAATGRADRNVAIIVSTTQRGVMTVDTDGLNLDTTNLMSNGDFETGDLTGWTTVTATVAVQTTDVEAGTYGMEMSSVAINNGTPAEVYQDISGLTLGQRYELMFWHKEEDAFPRAEYQVNGDFETSDLTGWTTESGVTASVTTGSPQAGTYKVEVTGALGDPKGIYQDITISPTVIQTFGFSVWFKTTSAKGVVQVGTPTNPDRYLNVPLTDSSSAWQTVESLNMFGLNGSGGTIRISLYAEDDLIEFDSMVFHALQDFPNVALKLGVAGDTDSLGSKGILRSSVGTKTGTTFVADATTHRITLEVSTLHNDSGFGTLKAFFDTFTLTKISTNPAATIRYLLNNFSSLTLNETSFDTAETLLGGWAFSGVITQPGTALAVAQRMADQCKSRVFLDRAGQVTIKPYDQSATSIYSFTESNIVRNSLQVDQTSADDVYTEFIVWFAPKTGGTAATEYQGMTYANPTETSHATISLNTNCATANTAYGFSRKLEVFANMIHSIETADKLLEYLVKFHTVQKYVLTFRSFLNAVHLEERDVIDVTHDLLPDVINGLTFYVEKPGFIPQRLETSFEAWEIIDVG